MNNKRGPKTKEDIKKDILTLKKINPEITAKQIGDQLRRIHKGSKFIPKERTIANIIKKNESNVKFKPIDTEWSIGACSNPDFKAFFPPESMAFLLFNKEVYYKIKKVIAEYPESPHTLLGEMKPTIRFMKWIMIFKPLVEAANIDLKIKGNDYHIEFLHSLATLYSLAEITSELTGQQFNSSELDKKFMELDIQDLDHLVNSDIWDSIKKGEK